MLYHKENALPMNRTRCQSALKNGNNITRTLQIETERKSVRLVFPCSFRSWEIEIGVSITYLDVSLFRCLFFFVQKSFKLKVSLKFMQHAVFTKISL